MDLGLSKRLIDKFCVIGPDGKRHRTDTFYSYTALVVRVYPNQYQVARRGRFNTTALYESALELKFDLPTEHLLGICEIAPDLKFATCIARNEKSRLRNYQIDLGLDRFEDPEEKDHLQITMTTSVNNDGEQKTDISKTVIRETRLYCNCFICYPRNDLSTIDRVTAVDRRIASAIQILCQYKDLELPKRKGHHQIRVKDLYLIDEE